MKSAAPLFFIYYPLLLSRTLFLLFEKCMQVTAEALTDLSLFPHLPPQPRLSCVCTHSCVKVYIWQSWQDDLLKN